HTRFPARRRVHRPRRAGHRNSSLRHRPRPGPPAPGRSDRPGVEPLVRPAPGTYAAELAMLRKCARLLPRLLPRSHARADYLLRPLGYGVRTTPAERVCRSPRGPTLSNYPARPRQHDPRPRADTVGAPSSPAAAGAGNVAAYAGVRDRRPAIGPRHGAWSPARGDVLSRARRTGGSDSTRRQSRRDLERAAGLRFDVVISAAGARLVGAVQHGDGHAPDAAHQVSAAHVRLTNDNSSAHREFRRVYH